jgi:hypothetical protein
VPVAVVAPTGAAAAVVAPVAMAAPPGAVLAAAPAAVEAGAGVALAALLRCACTGSEAIQAALARHAAAAADPSAVFDAPQPMPGDVVSLIPPWFVTIVRTNLAGISRATGVRDACDTARARGTFAVGGNGYYLPADASAGDLRALFTRVTGSDSLWQALAAGYRGAVLPALQQRIEETEARLQGYAATQGYKLDPVKLAHRTLALIDTEMVIASLQYGAVLPVTNAAWRRALSHQHHQAAGVAPVGTRPPAWDWRGLTEQLKCPGPARTKATSHFPYAPRERPPGAISTLDVAGLLRELERLDGPFSDTDPHIWLALDNLYAEELYPKPTLAPRIAAAAKNGTALVMEPAGKPHVDTIHDKAFEEVTLPERVSMGVIRPVSQEEAMRPGNVVSALTIAAKGALTTSAEERVAIESKDGKAIAALARTRAKRMLDATLTSINAGAKPADAAAAAHAAQLNEPKLRMCHSGHGLSEELLVGSFTMPTSTHLLETAAPASHMFCADMSNWYFAIMVGLAALYAHYVTWKGKFYLHLRMSMGLSPSAVVASIASAFIVYLAMRYGASALYNYIDDLLGLARTRERAQRDQELLHRAANVVAPGGLAEQKTRNPAPTQVALGLHYDFPQGTLSVSHDKLFSYAVHLFYVHACLSSADFRLRMAVTTPSLVSLTGKLGFLCTQVPLGRIHMRSLYAHSAQRQPPAAHFREQIVQDLSWWQGRMLAGTLPVTHFFSADSPPDLVHVCGGREVDNTAGPERLAPEGPERLAPEGPRAAAGGGARDTPVMRSDAGDGGAAAIFEGKVVYRSFTPQERTDSSDVREAAIVQDAAKALGPQWRGKRVVFVLDHSGNCDNINKGNCKGSKRVRDIIDWLYNHAEEHGYTFVAMWAPRESNSAADAISKCDDAGAAARVCAGLGLTLV